MDRPVIHRSSLPQSWVQHYPPSAPPNPSHPRPLAVQYPYDPRNDYTAPTLYPNVVSQQFPHRYSQPPLPNTLIPGGVRPRARSTIGDNNFSLENPPPVPQFPPFPSISPPQSSHGSSFPRTPVPPSKPPALQSQLSGYPLPVTNQRQSEVPIRPPPISARRSSSSPAINRIPTSGQPPPVPPLPPNYHSGYLQHAPQHVSPPPLSSIPVPSVYQPYRSDLSPLYASPHEIVPPPLLVPQTNASSLPKSHSDEEAELALAISISERESKEQSGQISQEERDLAKAIEESIRHASSFGMPVPYTDPGPSTLPATISPLSFPTPSPVAESPLSSHTSLASPNTPHLSASRPTSKASSPLMYPAQPRIDDDEALAEQLADEEERVAAGRSNPPLESPVLLSAESGIAVPVPALSPTSCKRHDAHRPMLTVVGSEPPPPLYHQVVSAQTSAPTKTSPTSPNVIPSLGRSSSATVVTPSSSRLSPIPGDPERPNNGRSQSLDAVPSSSSNSAMNTSVSARPNPLPIMEESADSPLVQSPSPSSVPATLSPTPNSFIDQQLLDGISFGFNTPHISSIRTTLKGGVPNVISLPSGRFVPFHIQAPNWRHLLKMMARLSGSRIEPSIEAMATTKQELKLRTIVQFVRVNTTSQDWRTVIYLTIDHPPPSTAHHKFTNGDVNTLPFSYATSPLPALLRDGPDAPMSKYYTIPATQSTPYPTLPISFPNMAMYLASAVEDSRRMAHDGSSGMKRLAKILDTLYPAEVELGMEDDGPDRSSGGVVNMFKNVFGRGRRDQRRNDDNYADLVTPFVPEWG